MKKTLVVVLIVVAVLFVAIMAFGGDEPMEVVNTSSPEATMVEEVYEVNSTEFVDAFEENQLAAEKEWSGKIVQFKAEISNITENGLSFYDVGSKEFSLAQVLCEFENTDPLLELKKGMEVVVRGTVDTQLAGVIMIDNCEVVN